MARKKCPRQGTRLKFDANPVSAAMYSSPMPHQGEVGTVVSVPLPGAGRKTCTGGHSQDLVYVDWPSVGTMGVARADVSKVKGRGAKQLQVNGDDDDRAKSKWLAQYASEVSKLLEGSKKKPTWEQYPAGHMYYGQGISPEEAARKYVADTGWRGRMHGLGDVSLGDFSIGQRVHTPHGPGAVTVKGRDYVGVQLDTGVYASVQRNEVQPTGEKQRFISGVGSPAEQHWDRHQRAAERAQTSLYEAERKLEAGVCTSAFELLIQAARESSVAREHARSEGSRVLRDKDTVGLTTMIQDFKKKCIR